MRKIISACAVAACLSFANGAMASPLPAVDGSYDGNYTLMNAFSPPRGDHGLWFSNLGLGTDRTWSVANGTANLFNGLLDLEGTVTNTGNGNTYSLDFDFQLMRDASHTGTLQCGSQNCGNPSPTQIANIQYFDGALDGSIGTISGSSGSLLDGLELSVSIMKPNAPDTGQPKLGQLGYGGNWETDDFGYSNWYTFTVLSQASSGLFDITPGSFNGDVNLTFGPNGNPGGPNDPPAIPLPAGLPLLLTALAGFAWMRKKAA